VNHKIKIIVHCQKHQLCFNLHHSYYRTSCRELAYKVSAQLDHVRLQSKCLIKIGWISKLLFREVVNFSDLSILFFYYYNHIYSSNFFFQFLIQTSWIITFTTTWQPSLQDFTVLPTTIFRRYVIKISSVIYLLMSLPTKYVHWLSFHR